MCESPRDGGSVSGALAMLGRALDVLNAADAASWPADVQAQALRELERVAAKQVAARSRVLAAFTGGRGYENDGQGSARTWVRWQTRVTATAAAGAVGWARRLSAHPVIADALAAGDLSTSWAREFCGWSDRLPDSARDDADAILVTAAGGGADLPDLAGLAEQMYQRTHQHTPGEDPGDHGDHHGDDRGVWLGITLGGAGRLDGDLAPGCAASLSAVLTALGKKAGPEDTRTAAQRRHDALEEACRRLIAAGTLPDRGGQPAQAHVHITLSQLRDMPGAPKAEAAWLAARAREPGWVSGPEAAAAGCDATVVPVVTGQVDWTALDRLTGTYLAAHGLGPDGSAACGCTCGGCACPQRVPLPPDTLARLRDTLLRMAADVLSGPAGLAAWLRRSQLAGGPGATAGLPLTIPLPLDTGQAEPTVPAHLRRAVTARHPSCAFPGCEHPASTCHIHHLVPRSRGGPTALHNLVPLCGFHHLTVIHRWGWTLSLHADGTTTAASPDGSRTLHSHSPPAQAA